MLLLQKVKVVSASSIVLRRARRNSRRPMMLPCCTPALPTNKKMDGHLQLDLRLEAASALVGYDSSRTRPRIGDDKRRMEGSSWCLLFNSIQKKSVK